jgi:hypothetical protein
LETAVGSAAATARTDQRADRKEAENGNLAEGNGTVAAAARA